MSSKNGKLNLFMEYPISLYALWIWRYCKWVFCFVISFCTHTLAFLFFAFVMIKCHEIRHLQKKKKEKNNSHREKYSYKFTYAYLCSFVATHIYKRVPTIYVWLQSHNNTIWNVTFSHNRRMTTTRTYFIAFIQEWWVHTYVRGYKG